jgi:hypothetical protein
VTKARRQYNGSRDLKPDMPGTSRKVMLRRRKKELIKLARRRKPDKRMTDGQWEELLEGRPLLAEIDAYVHDPFMIHWRRPLKDLQREMIDGKSLSRQRSDWFRKVQEFSADTQKSLDSGEEMSVADQWTLDQALLLARAGLRHTSSEPVSVSLAAYREFRWITRKMKRIVVQKYGVLIDQLRDPLCGINDLVTLEKGRWAPYGHNLRIELPTAGKPLGLIAGEPFLNTAWLPRVPQFSILLSFQTSTVRFGQLTSSSSKSNLASV